ncbi:TPA: hypothetical protein F6U11_15885 [Citrobacter freundii]|nr:hypothetical protein [Citrobacter freundii]
MRPGASWAILEQYCEVDFEGWRLAPYPTRICHLFFERYRRSQVGHGLRAATGAYTQYVRMASTARVQDELEIRCRRRTRTYGVCH